MSINTDTIHSSNSVLYLIPMKHEYDSIILSGSEKSVLLSIRKFKFKRDERHNVMKLPHSSSPFYLKHWFLGKFSTEICFAHMHSSSQALHFILPEHTLNDPKWKTEYAGRPFHYMAGVTIAHCDESI